MPADRYCGKLVGLDAALSRITSRSRIVTAMAAAEPQAFFEAAAARCAALDGVVVHCANPSRTYPCA